MNFYSQHGEDRWIVEHLKLPEHGVFVDVGAYDGVELSNTKHFEERGWTGLCVEGDPRQWYKLLANRKCDKYFGAAGVATGLCRFGLADIPSHSGQGRGTSTIEVPILPLSTLLGAYYFGPIDLLSIDVEGKELEVWESGLFGSFFSIPRIVIIEHDTYGLPSNKDAIRKVFGELPYREVHETPGNLIFERV